jgi:hypothetical protein
MTATIATPAGPVPDHPDHPAICEDICSEHEALALRITELRAVAEGMGPLPAREVDHRLESACDLIAHRILPHVHAEYEHCAHLALRDHRPIPGREQEREIEMLGNRLVEIWRRENAAPLVARPWVRGLLFDLHALLRLHFSVDR